MKPKHRTSEEIKQEIAELKKKLSHMEHRELVEATHREAIDALVKKGGLMFEEVANIYTRESESNKRRGGMRYPVKQVKIAKVTEKTVKLEYFSKDGYFFDAVTMKKDEAYYKLRALNHTYNKVEELA